MNLLTLDFGAYSVTAEPPLLGYKTNIILGLHFAERKDGRISIFDDTIAGDRRETNCTFLLSGQGNAHVMQQQFLEHFALYDMTLLCSSDGNFYPFGPDLGDAGTFGVAITEQGVTSTNGNPKDYFEIESKLTLQDAPAYSLPDRTVDGEFRFGAIQNLRFPSVNPASQSRTSSVYTTSRGGVVSSLAISPKESAYQSNSRNTTITVEGRPENIAALIEHLQTVVRGNIVNIYSPDQTSPYSNGGFQPFGPYNPVDLATYGYYRCKLASNVITVEHIYTNLFRLSVDLRYVGA